MATKQMQAAWSDDDVKKLDSLNISVAHLEKPPETRYLYGLMQRLSAKRLRIKGEPFESKDMKQFATKIPDLTERDCGFLLDAIKKFLDGEIDSQNIFNWKPYFNSHSAARMMAAEYALYHLCVGGKKTPLRDEIAERWKVKGSRISQVWKEHEQSINSWLGSVFNLTDRHNVPRDLVHHHLLYKVDSAHATYFPNKPRKRKSPNKRPESSFMVVFPAPVKREKLG